MLRKITLVLFLLLSVTLGLSGAAPAEGAYVNGTGVEEWGEWMDYMVPLEEESVQSLYEALSNIPLMAASGHGAWEGRFHFHADGSFNGFYYDEDADAIHESSFSGRFGSCMDVGGQSFWLWVEEVRTEQVPGSMAMSEFGIPIIYEEAPIEEDSYLILTEPGTPDELIPEMVRDEIGGVFGEWEDYSRFIILSRLKDGWGFFADMYAEPVEDLEPMPTVSPAEPTETPLSPDGFVWTGYWMAHDDSLAEMIISDPGNGTLHADVMFLPAADFEAVLTPQDDGSMRFETKYDRLKGQIVCGQDGTLHLSITGGDIMEDDEATEYQGYYAHGFTYYRSSYEEMWSQTPEDASSTEEDWLGEWTMIGGDSTLVIRRESGGFRTDVSLGSYDFSVQGELRDDVCMDVADESLCCLLYLNRKLDRIAMVDVGSDVNAVYDWMGRSRWGVVIYQRNGGAEDVPDAGETADPWVGLWRAQNDGHTALMQIAFGDMCDYFVQFTFDDAFTINGQLSIISDEMLYVIADDYITQFRALLTMNAGKESVVMDDIECIADEINVWLEDYDFRLDFVRQEDSSQPASDPAAWDSIALVPVPGKPGFLQVPVSWVDATSWIVGKDPNAYTPQRMIDGEETTAFQFSTKTTRLGQEYLTFAFEKPVTLDELWMKNGFWKVTDGKDQYTRNSRVRKMTMDVQYAGENGFRTLKTVSLKDDPSRKDWKVIDLMHIQNVTMVRIRIDEIFKGSKYATDVCISEMMFVQYEEQ